MNRSFSLCYISDVTLLEVLIYHHIFIITKFKYLSDFHCNFFFDPWVILSIFIYIETIFLGTYKFRVVITSWWIDLFVNVAIVSWWIDLFVNVAIVTCVKLHQLSLTNVCMVYSFS